jgi:hypothetical protein
MVECTVSRKKQKQSLESSPLNSSDGREINVIRVLGIEGATKQTQKAEFLNTSATKPEVKIGHYEMQKAARNPAALRQ